MGGVSDFVAQVRIWGQGGHMSQLLPGKAAVTNKPHLMARKADDLFPLLGQHSFGSWFFSFPDGSPSMRAEQDQPWKPGRPKSIIDKIAPDSTWIPWPHCDLATTPICTGENTPLSRGHRGHWPWARVCDPTARKEARGLPSHPRSSKPSIPPEMRRREPVTFYPQAVWLRGGGLSCLVRNPSPSYSRPAPA